MAVKPAAPESAGDVAELATLFPGRYISLTSFKRDGAPVSTPLWFVQDGARLLAITDRDSAKVRRLRHNPHALVAASRGDGKLRGASLAARVEIRTGEVDLEHAARLLRSRYGLTYAATMLAYRLMRRLRGQTGLPPGAVLVITID